MSAGAAAALTFAALLALTSHLGWVISLPTAVATAAVVLLLVILVRGRPAGHAVLHLAVASSGAVSLIATASVLVDETLPLEASGNWVLLEVGSVLLLVAAGSRWGQGVGGVLATGLAAAANCAWILRFLPDLRPVALVAGLATWSIGTLVAVGAGAYPRRAEAHRLLAVAAARAAQRRQLERDLHDYVAHDLSGILSQAQAARFAAGDDPETMRRVLAGIEGAATSALTAMDRSLELLRADNHEGGDAAAVPLAPPARHPDLRDLPGAVTAFAEASAATVTASYADGLEQVPLEASTVLHRVVIESLTNVRRHAPGAERVEVEVRRTVDAVIAVVRNRGGAAVGDGSGEWAGSSGSGRAATSRLALQPGRRSGTGLAEVATRLAELGGTLRAGPLSDGWETEASIPLGRSSFDPATRGSGG
ncbi:sensor histidine kinase [Intrasporangium sp.]|uniref:sensor histidine kinase n=1 Tax=Intrasporangium sp. TaxID=1925024 RepID=UPI0029395F52|nr:histidine kinase [Intrasporangium sp.]MDV3220351.1 histidine kinase [Intrasporangium sp.]